MATRVKRKPVAKAKTPAGTRSVTRKAATKKKAGAKKKAAAKKVDIRQGTAKTKTRQGRTPSTPPRVKERTKNRAPKKDQTGQRVNPQGRRSILTPELQGRIVDALRLGNYDSTACQYAGISPATFYDWLNRGEAEIARLEFSEAKGEDAIMDPNEEPFIDFVIEVKNAMAESEVVAVGYVRSAMKDNWQAAMTFLERKWPDRWGRKDRTFNTNLNIGGNQGIDYSKLTQEELDELERITAKLEGNSPRTIDAKPV